MDVPAAFKPRATPAHCRDIVRELYGITATNVTELSGYDDQNFRVQVRNGHGYILKIVNSLDSRNVAYYDGQVQLLLYLASHHVICPVPIKNVHGKYFSIETIHAQTHVVRLLAYQPQTTLDKIANKSERVYTHVGRYLAELSRTLRAFSHAAIAAHKTVWMLIALPQCEQIAAKVLNAERKVIFDDVVTEFTEKVMWNVGELSAGVIHGDFNEGNILVEMDAEQWKVAGVLDFGDCHVAPYVFDLAITIAYGIMEMKKVDVGRLILEGFTSIYELNALEKKLLKVCVAARIVQSLTLGLYSYERNPNDYVLTTNRVGWKMLTELWDRDDDELMAEWGL